MNIFTFDSRRKKRFTWLLAIFYFLPLVFFLPVPAVKIFLFFPLLFWINLPGIPLALLGIPYFEIHEFGAVPQGAIGYGLIALSYAVAAFVLSLIGRRDTPAQSRGHHDNRQ